MSEEKPAPRLMIGVAAESIEAGDILVVVHNGEGGSFIWKATKDDLNE